MKLLLDDEGHAVLKDVDGKKLPVYEYEDGSKKEFDAGATLSGMTKKLKAEGEEKQRHFDRAEKAEAGLKAFEGIEVDKAKEAIRVVKNLSDKKLLDDKGVEAVKTEVRTDMKILAEEREKALKESHVKEREDWDSKFSHQDKMIRNLVVGNLFANDNHFSGDKRTTIYPPDDAAKIFGPNVDVKIDEGKVIVGMIDNAGKPLMSKIEHGEPAGFHEGIDMLIDKHPRKTEIMRGGDGKGPGSKGNLDGKSKKLDDMTSLEMITHGLNKHEAGQGQ